MEVESYNRLWEGFLRSHKVRNFQIWGPLMIYHKTIRIRKKQNEIRQSHSVLRVPLHLRLQSSSIDEGNNKKYEDSGFRWDHIDLKSHFNFRFQPSSNEGTRYDIEEGTREARVMKS